MIAVSNVRWRSFGTALVCRLRSQWPARAQSIRLRIQKRFQRRLYRAMKMLGPLGGLFIFPVFLGVAMLPVIIRLISVLPLTFAILTGKLLIPDLFPRVRDFPATL